MACDFLIVTLQWHSFFTYSLWLAIYNCGVHRDVAETMVWNTNDENLRKAAEAEL